MSPEYQSSAWRARAWLGQGGTFVRLGGADANPSGSISASDAAIVGTTLYVTWSVGGQVFVRSVDMTSASAPWVDVAGPSGAVHNASASCTADRPTLASDRASLWLAWSENCDATSPKWKVYVRSLR